MPSSRERAKPCSILASETINAAGAAVAMRIGQDLLKAMDQRGDVVAVEVMRIELGLWEAMGQGNTVAAAAMGVLARRAVERSMVRK